MVWRWDACGELRTLLPFAFLSRPLFLFFPMIRMTRDIYSDLCSICTFAVERAYNHTHQPSAANVVQVPCESVHRTNSSSSIR